MVQAVDVRLAFITLLMAANMAFTAPPNEREKRVRADRKRVEAEGFWIYNDLPRGYREAAESKRPLIVALRCIPCEECVKLDDDLLDNDPRVRPLLEKFVRVRVVSTNSLDLNRFRFDTDQSFAIFLLNADGTLYGRYGTRSHRTDHAGDVSPEGLAAAMELALDLHAGYPANRAALAGKQTAKSAFATPRDYPTLKGKYGAELDYSGNVVRSCIHCHQIGDAMLDEARREHGVLPEEILFRYPHPKVLGLELDPKTRPTARSVKPDSIAAKAGMRPGDILVSLAGQPILSAADIQWVLDGVPADGGTVSGVVRRGDAEVAVELKPGGDWRRADDIAWRASSWPLRQKAPGGMKLDPLDDDERAEAKIPPGAMALAVRHVGEWVPHDVAKRAGVKRGDILIGYAGRTDLLRETDVLAHGMMELKPGSTAELRLLRNGKPMTVRITLPK
jgi:hypothetical protein